LFKSHCRNKYLNYQGIIEIFDPVGTLPWINIDRIVKSEIVNDEINIDMQSWISLWNLLTNQDYKRCFKFLKYIGFEGSLSDAFNITNKKSKLSDILKTINREVFHAYVIGHEGSGKTQLLDHFIEK